MFSVEPYEPMGQLQKGVGMLYPFPTREDEDANFEVMPSEWGSIDSDIDMMGGT